MDFPIIDLMDQDACYTVADPVLPAVQYDG